MKQNLLLILSILFFGQLGAQNIEISPSPIIISDVDISAINVKAHCRITNTADTTRSFRWNRVIVEMTEGWNVAVCDTNQCYVPTVETEMFSLAGGQEGPLIVYAYPNGIEGGAIVEVIVTDKGNESLSVSNLYYFNALPSSTIDLSKNSIKVYPNPSNGLFTIKGDKQIGRLDVYSLTGRKVAAFTYGHEQWYNISNLPKGIYLVRLIDRDGQQMITKLINKM